MFSSDWHARRTFGSHPVPVSRLGLGSSYGATADDVTHAFDRGINYFYWGSARTATFGKGITALVQHHRGEMVVVVQTYARFASQVVPSLERALRRLKLDHVDYLLLGMWNHTPPPALLAAAQRAVAQGKARHLMLSCHQRPMFATYLADARFDALMTRYNASHPGSETEVFPLLPQRSDGVRRPGMVAYTATRWGNLLEPRFQPSEERAPRGRDCYRFALTHPDVDLVLCGPANRAQLDEALSALDEGPMDAEALAWMKRVGTAVKARAGRPAVRWLDRLDDGWTSLRYQLGLK